jgi:UDP-glucuronate 4-epimerase
MQLVRKNWIFLVVLLGLLIWFATVWFDTSGPNRPHLKSGGDEMADYSAVETMGKWQDGLKRVILVTGGAGFIGSHTAQFLLARGDDVIIIDEVNDYYDVSIKEDNLALLATFAASKPEHGRLTVHRLDICDREGVRAIFKKAQTDGAAITHICHLAARAGVRYSIENPDSYIHSNLQGTLVMLDMARDFEVANFVYASSSSVYGHNEKVPFAETDPVDNPVSPYAATKRGCELLAYTYNHLYGIPMAGLRFFTVYGPRGRPDMAPFKFIDAVYRGKPIDKYGDGTTSRDYTFVSDIVTGIVAAIDKPFVKMQLFNLGNSRTINLNRFIEVVEHAVGKKAQIRHMSPQPGDVPITYADLRKSQQLLGYSPQVTLEEGIQKMADWYIGKYGKGQRQ